MAKNKTSLRSRAWRLLRLALLWARKGGAFKLDLRMFFKSIKSNDRTDRIGYFEREFSFDKTPLFNFKMHRRMPKIPCVNSPPVDSDDDGDDWIYYLNANGNKKESIEKMSDDDGELDCEEVEEVDGEEKGIDLKAEEFIEKFYEEMNFQRQVSLLQYNEMLHRGMS